ncbi:BT_3987 domain-containing protein [Pedobacter endophyticus]|uniref:DUF1735 domain-containing protein n=1 Tax=Pedobacter endophyticus TaxID=2789740 RepID=A0A7U3Q3X6_9SPHI|nr:DUF1735 domain-containing protein [Pedobacter endophyticus]QPH38145.1 DUF1735 domain-containing protein [Pedobacter endophyticus]
MKKNILKSITLLLAVTSLTSCLKDDRLVLDPAKGHNVIEFANPAQIVRTGTPSPMYAFSYESTSSPVLPVTVSYSGPEATAPQDITVQIAVGADSKITEYNTATGDHFVKLQPASYTISATEVVIKAGTSKATFNVSFKPATFNFAAAEVLPLTITSASSGIISGNFNTILLNVSAKNAYDGVYAMQAGSFVQRYSNPTTPTTGDNLNGSTATNPDVTLTTVGANTVQIGNLKWAGGTSNVAGIDNLQATVDPATNLVTMKALGNATLANIPGSVNKYDPATKTFTLNFDWNQTGAKRVYSLNIKYKASR